jgi:mannose-1-phosphate guanylyltransferase
MIFVILCGGSGTRLWPLSRSDNPKQLHPLVSEKTLLQDTIHRVHEIVNQEDSFFYFVTNLRILSEVEKNIEEMNLSKDKYNILVEPISRNSSPAILMPLLFSIHQNHQNQFMTVMSSDHAWDDHAFCKMLQKDQLETFSESIITLGIKPLSPHTGYGYIKRKENSYEIEEFKEKPNLEMAKKYVETGQYLWNSGTFIFKPNTLFSCFQTYQPEMLQIANLVYKTHFKVNDQIIIFSENEFSQFPNIAFDIAIMEKIQNGIVLPYLSTWSDIGSFDAVYELAIKNSNQNVIKGNQILTYQTKDSFIQNKTNQFIALVGIENIVVVNTEDALLIMNKNQCQDIKKIIEQLPEEYK